MTQEQQSIAEDFANLIEAEYELCVREIRRTKKALHCPSTAELNDEDIVRVNFANSEIESLRRYWSLRLVNLIEFIERKNYKLGEELGRKYLYSE
jgi:hypothetical protein